MKARAGAIVALALLSALSCTGNRPPSTDPIAYQAADPWAADFLASGTGPRGRLRLRGLLAVSPTDRLRLEIAGLPGAGSLLLVAGPRESSVLLTSERLHYRGSDSSAFLRRSLGLDLSLAELPAILRGKREALTGECTAALSRWRTVEEIGAHPTRVKIRCGDGRLRLKLSGARPVPAENRISAFDHLEPPGGYREVGAEELVEALRRLTQSR